jgi:low affinity Fe/Cu permease
VNDHAAADLVRQKRPFTRATGRLTNLAGSAWAFGFFLAYLLVWTWLGVLTRFPHWWELTVTVAMPFVTVLMMVVLQHTQNHDSRAMQLKLDELIRSIEPAENAMITVEDAGTDELEQVQREFRKEVSNS